MNTMLPFLSPLLKHHLPNLSSLFQRNVRAHLSRSSRLTVKGCNQQECFALDLLCSSRLLVHGSPWPACRDLSASVSRMHVCHFELVLDLIMVPIF